VHDRILILRQVLVSNNTSTFLDSDPASIAGADIRKSALEVKKNKAAPELVRLLIYQLLEADQ